MLSYANEDLPYKKVHLVGSFTTSEGCVVRYDVYIDIVSQWGWPPVKVKSVEGTVKLSGNCSGTQHINIQFRATVTCYPVGGSELVWDEIDDEGAMEDLEDLGFKAHLKTEACLADTDDLM